MDYSRYEKMGLAVDVVAFMLLFPLAVIWLVLSPLAEKYFVFSYGPYSLFPLDVVFFAINFAIWRIVLEDRQPIILKLLIEKDFDDSTFLPLSKMTSKKNRAHKKRFFI